MNTSLLGYGTLAAVVIGVVVGVVLFKGAAETAVESESVAANTAGAVGGATEGAAAGAVGTLENLNFRLMDYNKLVATVDDFGRDGPGASGENIIHADKPLKTETLTIALPLDGMIEYKAIMQAGDSVVYQWESAADIYYDFHAHQPSEVQDGSFFTRYAEGEGKVDRGMIVAPYTGQHGWFFLNLSDGPAEIELTVSGYYDEIVRLDLGGY
jgi:hypothetical protein